MKSHLALISLISLLLNFYSNSLHSQDRIPLVDTRQTLIDGIEAYDQEEYEDALDYFGKISPNDTNGFTAYYETLLTLNALERYGEVIEKVAEAKRGYWDTEPQMHIAYATALENTERMEAALEQYDKGIEQWPTYAPMTFNKAVALYNAERYEESLDMYQRTLELNPFHAGTHLQLGLLCADEGYLAEALMCFNAFLISEPASSRSLGVLAHMNDMVERDWKGESEGVPIYPEGQESNLSELSLFIKNRIALDKKYKVSHKLKAIPIVKVNHLLLENLTYTASDKSFWMQFYVPLFTEIKKKDFFDEFIYLTMLSNTSNSTAQKYITKYNYAIKSYFSWVREEWESKFETIEVMYKGALTEKGVSRYNSGEIFLVGHTDLENATCDAETYNTSGSLSGKGRYKGGKREGAWTYYNIDGTLSGEFNYVGGDIQGILKNYDELGYLDEMVTVKDNKANGMVISYDYGGVKLAKGYLKNGELDGNYTRFFPNGQVKESYGFKDGELNGPYKSYFSDGSIKTRFNRIDGKIEGEYRSFYLDGKAYEESEYVNGEKHGPFKRYSYNGNLASEGTYKKGGLSGLYKTYYSNGKLLSETVYDDNGKETGTKKSYSKDGWLTDELDFKKGEIVAYRFYNKEGEVLKSEKKKGGKFYYEGFDEDGTLISKGNYEVGDKGQDGEWTNYDNNGNLKSVRNFSEGLKEGMEVTYFPNGKIDAEVNYTEGEKDGYYREYFRNGQMYKQGWFVEDQVVGSWEGYYIDGAISDRWYYIDDEMHGSQDNFDVTGKLIYSDVYHFGTWMARVVYDSLGNEFEYLELDTGKIVLKENSPYGFLRYERNFHNRELYGKSTYYFPNGQISSTGNYVYGDRDGDWKFYYDNGQVSSEGAYLEGGKVGEWVYYYRDGTLKEKETFNYGNLDGLNVAYHDNGKMESETMYESDSRNGLSKYYGYDGKLQMVRKYKDGEIIAIATQNMNSDNPTWQELKDETGSFEILYDNGKVAREFTMEKGSFEGPYMKYYANGKLQEMANYEYDALVGEVKGYFANGNLRYEGEYTYGKRTGDYKTYHSNGKLKSSLNYINGRAHGWYEEFSESGKLIHRKLYQDGVIVIIEK